MSNLKTPNQVNSKMAPNPTIVELIKKKMRLSREEVDKYRGESVDLQARLEQETSRKQELEGEVARLTKRIIKLEEDLDNYQERLVIATYKIANNSQLAASNDVIHNNLAKKNKLKQDRVATLEAQLAQSTLQESEANRKYNEICRKLLLTEIEVDKAESRVSQSETRAVRLEEELKALGKCLQALEASQERKDIERDSCEQKYRVMAKLLEETETRAAFAELSVLKLGKQVESLNEDLARERDNYQATKQIITDNLDFIELVQMTHSTFLNLGQNVRTRLLNIDPNGTPLQMLVSQRIKQGRLAVVFLGIITIIMGIIFSSIPWIDYILLKQLRLWNGSLSFQYWQKPGVLRLTKVYIFNMTNPDNFLNNGERPKLQEIGPFVYKEDMEKVNIKFHDNGTVTFQHKKILHFVPELSVNKHQKLVVPNIPLLSLSTQSNSLGYVLQKTISFVLNLGRYKPFVSVTAEDLVFGYEDGIVNLAHHFYPKHKKPKNNIMGLLNGRNGTLKDVQTIYTGEGGMQEFGLMENMNGLQKLPFWDESPCSDIKGSEGSFFPPRHFTKKDVVYVFDKDICRVLPLQYRYSEKKQGILVDVFTPADNTYQTVEEQPSNKCFCPGNQYCPPKGLQNIGPCHFDAPLYASNPHFYEADSSLLEKFDGLQPDKEKHSSYFKIQPKLGVPLEAKVRLQVNLKVDNAPNVAPVANFPSIIFPIMWLEEGISDVSPPIRRWIYLATTFSDMASPLITYGFIFLGTCVLIGVFINTYKSIVFTKETIEVGMKTFRRASSINNKVLIARDSYTLIHNMQKDQAVAI